MSAIQPLQQKNCRKTLIEEAHKKETQAPTKGGKLLFSSSCKNINDWKVFHQIFSFLKKSTETVRAFVVLEAFLWFAASWESWVLSELTLGLKNVTCQLLIDEVYCQSSQAHCGNEGVIGSGFFGQPSSFGLGILPH